MSARRPVPVLLLAALLWTAAGYGQDAAETWSQESAETELSALERIDLESTADRDALDSFGQRVDAVAERAEACRAETQARIDRFRALQPAVDGTPAEGDPGEDPIQALNDRLAQCQYVLARAQELKESIIAAEARLQGQLLVARGPSIDAALPQVAAAWREYLSRARQWIADRIAAIGIVRWLGIFAALGVAMVAGFQARRRLAAPILNTWPVLSRLLPAWTGIVGAAAGIALLAPTILDAALPLAVGLLMWLVGQLGLGLWLRESTPDGRLHRLRWQGAVLWATTVIALLHRSTVDPDWVRRTLELLVAVQALAVCVVARGVEARGDVWRLLSNLCILLLAGAVVAWLMGYYTLAGYVSLGLVLTWLTWAVYHLIRTVVIGLLDGLDSGEGKWFAWSRRQLLIGADQSLPGYTWFRLLAELIGLLGIVAGLMSAWRLERFGLPSFGSLMTEGVPIGQVRIVPVKVAVGLLLFALLLAVFGRTRHLLTNQLANRSRMNFATAETIATVTGYVGFVVAVLVGLSAAGFKLSNLALILGALSVGIGFGLQNVVNNFVSGLILLFERPIKTGDWIRVGDTDGYVTRIRVRSTEIQTLDRSEVIVPNSELIALQVTNFTLHSGLGRIICPVGVAYGSDTELVKETLIAVAHQHDNVLQQGSSAPRVIFKGFGDSSLDFELRCFLTDIRQYWPTLSDLNFAIDAAFRKAGIEIPFPQRDLHLRSTVASEPPDTL